MKQGTRLYINITNHCNTDCPFCCMYSGKSKKTYMSFGTFKSIIDSCEGEFELQLEGGEPLTHKDMYLFIEYAISTERCKKVIILTNGITIWDNIKRIISLVNWYKIEFEIKISINYYLLDQRAVSIHDMAKLIFAVQYIPNLNVLFNVRLRDSGDNWIVRQLKEYQILTRSNVYGFQSYGRLLNSDKYDKPVIVQNIDKWKIYASDGSCYGQDLIARSEHEGKLL